jgi:hypothetical protein
MRRVPIDGTGGTYLQTRSRVTVATPVGKCKGRNRTRLDVDPLARYGCLKESEGLVLARRVFDGACQLALQTTDAPLGIDEHGLHGLVALLSGSYSPVSL